MMGGSHTMLCQQGKQEARLAIRWRLTSSPQTSRRQAGKELCDLWCRLAGLKGLGEECGAGVQL